jgi:SH3-like domain-containing protein
MKSVIPIGLALAFLAPMGAAFPAELSPYFVSLKSDEVFMREGPSEQHKVKWVYHRKGLPLEVFQSFEAWRRVKDMDGEIGWIHATMLSRDRTAIIAKGADTPVRQNEAANADVVASAKPGSVGKLVKCGPAACEVRFDTAGGWIDRARLWGVRDGKDF